MLGSWHPLLSRVTTLPVWGRGGAAQGVHAALIRCTQFWSRRFRRKLCKGLTVFFATTREYVVCLCACCLNASCLHLYPFPGRTFMSTTCWKCWGSKRFPTQAFQVPRRKRRQTPTHQPHTHVAGVIGKKKQMRIMKKTW